MWGEKAKERLFDLYQPCMGIETPLGEGEALQGGKREGHT